MNASFEGRIFVHVKIEETNNIFCNHFYESFK